MRTSAKNTSARLYVTEPCRSRTRVPKSGQSVEHQLPWQAAAVVPAVCEELYDHHYYPNKVEAIEKDASLASYKSYLQRRDKMRKLDEAKIATKAPANKENYIPYKYVLPLTKTLNVPTQLLAVHTGAEAANALYTSKTPIWR